MALVLQQVRRCDGQCCRESPRFPNADGTDCDGEQLMPCNGNGPDHCCRIKGTDCKHLVFDHTDSTGYFRKWACALRIKHDSWDDVLADPDYPTGSWAPGVNCRDWPGGTGNNAIPCSICGAN